MSGNRSLPIWRSFAILEFPWDYSCLLYTSYFSVERYDLAEENSFNLDDSSFRAFVVLEGTGTIRCGEEEIPYRPADCFFVPAGKKTVAFEGSGIVLKVQV